MLLVYLGEELLDQSTVKVLMDNFFLYDDDFQMCVSRLFPQILESHFQFNIST